MKSILIIILSLHVCLSVGNTVYTSVKNFPKSVYGAASQNWSVGCNNNHFLYFANHKGLLEFDGASWNLMYLPHETILRAVYIDSESMIYTAGYMELGFWKPDTTGSLKYFSLNDLAKPHLSHNDEFWSISGSQGNIYFQSFGKLLVYTGDTIIPVHFPGFVNTMIPVKDKVLAAVSDMGIFYVEDFKPHPYIIDPIFRNTTVRFLLPVNEQEILIGTATHGIYRWDGSRLSIWNEQWNDYFINNEVNRAQMLPGGEIIIGTIADGIIVFDREREMIYRFNTSNGLQNNTILGITSDKFGNIWLALDNGIDFISSDQFSNFKFEPVPNLGSVYDAAIHDGNLYLGTNQGLFFRELTSDSKGFRFIPETKGQVWFCKGMGNSLLVGHNNGTFAVSKGKVELLSGQAGGFCLREDPVKPGSFIISSYSHLVRGVMDAGVPRQEKLIEGFSDLIRYIEFDHRGNLWASHMHRGVYKLQFDATRDSIINSTYYGDKSAIGKDHNVHVFKVENRVVFTTGDSLFTYDDIRDSIVPYSFLNDYLGSFAAAHRIIEAPDHHYWFITKKAIGLFHIYNDMTELVNVIPRSIFSKNLMIDDFENLLPTGPNKAILCLENGMAEIEPQKMKKSEIVNFKPTLRNIFLSGPKDKQISSHAENQVINVKNKFNNITLRYSFPHYTHYTLAFRALLKNTEHEWLENKNEPVFSFDRLPVGTYILAVRAVDPWGIESQEHTITIKVLPPWYLTSYAKYAYVVLLLSVFAVVQIWLIRSTKKRERTQLEKREQELIRLRNEKLGNEVEHKSKELANLTMAIIKKNEFLMNLKDTFTVQKEQLGSRYPDKYFNHIARKIDENIAGHDDWSLFETNFERAHEQFLQKLKDLFPGLTPKDLRLSAFLRMNLSSKEIAPLMGISVRGVENHRYRLRKKMGLEHDDNLIDMILKL